MGAGVAIGFRAGLIIIFADDVVKRGDSRGGVMLADGGVQLCCCWPVLVVGAPYWLVRMATSGRYRAGLAGRLGRVPAELRAAVAGRQVVWVHAVSVGEVMAATRLVGELEAALPEWVVVVSTTTATGQRLAQERLAGIAGVLSAAGFSGGGAAVSGVVRPKLVVTMESELWPRLMEECARRGFRWRW